MLPDLFLSEKLKSQFSFFNFPSPLNVLKVQYLIPSYYFEDETFAMGRRKMWTPSEHVINFIFLGPIISKLYTESS